MKRIVVLSGAGISAESGLKTFRDADGLWEGYDINEVATPEGWERNPELVLDFYNMRRKGVIEASPNQAHEALAKLEAHFDVQIITQNIDDLHERAGSTQVMHLHGEVRKAQSTHPEAKTYDIDGWELHWGDQCPQGYQLRPFVVWFGEAVPMIEPAAQLCSTADILVVVGTSLAVYPAAGLIHYAPRASVKHLVDPKANELMHQNQEFTLWSEPATSGVVKLVEQLIQEQNN